jgi:hypothetical protein
MLPIRAEFGKLLQLLMLTTIIDSRGSELLSAGGRNVTPHPESDEDFCQGRCGPVPSLCFVTAKLRIATQGLQTKWTCSALHRTVEWMLHVQRRQLRSM